MTSYKEDIRVSCFKTCFLEYMIIILSLLQEAVHLDIEDVNSNFLEFIKINFDNINENKIRLNISIERDDQFCMEYVVYILLIIDVYISMFDQSNNNNNDIKNTTCNSDREHKKDIKRQILIDLSDVDKNVLLSENCKNCENSLYGFATALFENRIKPFSFFSLSRNKSCNDYYVNNPMSVFFTIDEVSNISRRIKTSRKNEKFKVILSKYRKKIKDNSVKTPHGLILYAKAADILIQYDKENILLMDICINITDKESYVYIKTIEKQTKQLNKSLIDYLDAFIKIDNKICPDHLQVINDIISFKERLTFITQRHFPMFKFNGSRKHAAISKAIQSLTNECESFPNKPKYNNIIKEHGNNTIDNLKWLDLFMNTILPLLTNDTITNMWFNRLFLTNTHREIITKDDIKSSNFLRLLRKVEQETDKVKTMDILRIFSKVCNTLRHKHLPFSFQDCKRLIKRQKINNHNNLNPLRDIEYIQTLPKGTINIKNLLSQHGPSILGYCITDKQIGNYTNHENNNSRPLSRVDVSKFHQYFTSIGKELLL
nr:MAG: hypothetical protein [Marsupenaeus japonicus endogenous nimavirus]